MNKCDDSCAESHSELSQTNEMDFWRNSVDLAMNDLCYEYFQDGIFLNSFDCVFVHKEVRCTKKLK